MLNDYLKELNKVSLLSLDEERKLWCAYKEHGDAVSRQRLIESYQPLVFRIARELDGRTDMIMDMIQEGTIGLIEAVERFDYLKGVAFSVYARYRIRGRMLNLFESQAKGDMLSLDGAWDGPGESTLIAALVDDTIETVEAQVESSFVKRKVNEAVERLSGKERDVITGVYLFDKEPTEVAKEMEISISYVHKLQKRAIRRMRGMLARFAADLNQSV
jgi:RNA polymerase sporulation-specific sigma factor